MEFKINIEQPSRTKSQLFIGVVNKSKYKEEYLTSTYWKDSPASYYWDIWNTKLISTNDAGNQEGLMSGYGCICDDNDCVFGIEYNSRDRSISFYKNGYS